MKRALAAAIFAVLLASCATVPQPSYRYSFVVDGRIAKTQDVAIGTDLVSKVVRPRNGESAIWQIYNATYAYMVLEISETDRTDSGGFELELEGDVFYYRKLKMAQEDGNDVVVDGDPIKTVAIKPKTFTVELNAPALVPLAEGLQVEIALIPPDAGGRPGAR